MRKIHVVVDVGYGNTKGIKTVIPSGVKQLPGKPPLDSRVIEYDGKYYAIGGFTSEIPKDRFASKDSLILTLAMIAETLKSKGVRKADIRLGVGLPLTRMGAEKRRYIEYLSRDRRLQFKYEAKSYSVEFSSIDVFPQGYAAAIDMLGSLRSSAVIIDIGSRTVDILKIVDGLPDISSCMSLQIGVITAIQEIQESLRQIYGEEVEEVFIRDIILNKNVDISEEYLRVIKKGLADYADKIVRQLTSLRISTTTQIVFVGGGASIIKNYLEDKSMKYDLIEDVCINSKGYAKLLAAKYGDD